MEASSSQLSAGPDPGRTPVVGAAAGTGELAMVFTGGGARAAYQVGVLSWIARRVPELRVPILTGVSAGAVNAAHLAGHHGTFAQAVSELSGLWHTLEAANVFRAGPGSLGLTGARWALRLLSGGMRAGHGVRALLDTDPLRQHLEEAYAAIDGELTGIDYNLHRGSLKAVAISTTSYTTGQSVVWVQGRNIQLWERPMRRSVQTRLTMDHVMASAALPIFFPAVRIGRAWHGDGGVRLTAPLSPALHLGADRILAITTRSETTFDEADRPSISGYPPPAQVFGLLMNAIFLDVVDQDALRMERMTRILGRLPEEERDGMRPVRLMVIRPTEDLGSATTLYEPRLPRTFRFLTRGMGTRETGSSDMLSLLMFQPDYLAHLIRLGERDAEAMGDELIDFVLGAPDAGTAADAAAVSDGALPLRSGD
jgi:NTE family protein